MIELAVPYISQRSVFGDLDKDGKADAFQTCLTTSTAMVVNFYFPGTLPVDRANKEIVALASRLKASRYHHSVIVNYLAQHKISSVFLTSATLPMIEKHLQSGNPIIWANKLTHSGHCVVLSGYNDLQVKINDPFGEVFVKGNTTSYKDIRKPYWLSKTSFQKFSMVQSQSGFHWVHLVKKL